MSGWGVAGGAVKEWVRCWMVLLNSDVYMGTRAQDPEDEGLDSPPLAPCLNILMTDVVLITSLDVDRVRVPLARSMYCKCRTAGVSH